jgi:hypothetical protein
MLGVTIERGELLNELITGNDTRHQTLIITEEREANHRSKGDGEMELLAPETGGCGPHVEEPLVYQARTFKVT